jgi:hypothetical protein
MFSHDTQCHSGRQEKGCEIHHSADAFRDCFSDRSHGKAAERVAHKNHRLVTILARHLVNQGNHCARAILLADISVG